MEERSITEYLSSYSSVDSPESPDDGVQHRNGHHGERTIDPEDVEGEVFDWVLTHLEPRQWPLSLSTVLAKTVAQQVTASLKLKPGAGTDEELTAGRLRVAAMEVLAEQCALWREKPELAQELPHTVAASLPVSSHGVRNCRRKMEDRHVALPDLNFVLGLQGIPQHSYYAVFDGHAGAEAADYATAHLHHNIAAQPDFLTNPENAIREGFILTDRNFLQRSSQEGLKSGCTAVCCLVREQQKMWVGWAGDSQAILVRKGIPEPLVDPHKPERVDERQRIEKLGGVVLLMGVWRVNGALSVSRSIGDAEQKPYVTSEPDIVSVDFDGTEDFIVIGCDGLWDHMTFQEAATKVYSAVLEDPESAPYAAHTLVQTARDLGSSDNTTAVVVFLRDPRTFDPSLLEHLQALAKVKEDPYEHSDVIGSRPFNASEFDAAEFNSNGFAAHTFDADSVNSHAYNHSNDDELVEVASGVVQDTIETALHKVNDDVITAGQIVDQVHLLHSEKESGKFSDLPEQFQGAEPTGCSFEDKFDEADGMLHSANGCGDVPEFQNAPPRHNPFDDEGYGHDFEASDCLQSSPNTAGLPESCTGDAEHSFTLDKMDVTAGEQPPEETPETTFLTAPDVTPKTESLDVDAELEVCARQPSPVSPCVAFQEAPPTGADQNAFGGEQPEASKEMELPDEGVDFSTLPEDAKELESAVGMSEQPVLAGSNIECLSALPEDKQNLGFLEDNHGLLSGEAGHMTIEPHVDIAEGHASAFPLGQQCQPHEESQLAFSASPQYLSPEHFKDRPAESEVLESSFGFNQSPSIQSDDLVSIDLNMSAVQSLTEPSVPQLERNDNPASFCDTAFEEKHKEESTERSAESGSEQHYQPAGETLESLGVDDVEDNSLGGSAESVVEKVAAEAEQQESAIIFCELKEDLESAEDVENVFENQLSSAAEQKIGNLSYNIPVEEQAAVDHATPEFGFNKEDTHGKFSETVAESPCSQPGANESPRTYGEIVCGEQIMAANLQGEAPESVGMPISSPFDELGKPCDQPPEAAPGALSSLSSPPPKSPVVEQFLEQNAAAFQEAQFVQDSTKAAAVEEIPAPVLDIGAIPENIPEAEGVTEDSDSEKDSGWQFVKPLETVFTPSSEGLPKENNAVSNLETPPVKQDFAEVAASSVLDSEQKSAAAADTKANAVPEQAPVVPKQASEVSTEQKATVSKAASTAKASPAAPKTKPVGTKASPALKSKAPSADKPSPKTTTKAEAPAKPATTARAPLKKQPTASKPSATSSTSKPGGATSTVKKEVGAPRKPESAALKASAASASQAKKPVSAPSRPPATSARSTATPQKPSDKPTAPLTKPRAPTVTSRTEAAAAERKPAPKPTPAKPPTASRMAPKPAQSASGSTTASRVGSRPLTSRPTTAPTASKPAATASKPAATSRVAGTSAAAPKKAADTGATAAKPTTTKAPAARDAKLGKDSANVQLAGARKPPGTRTSTGGSAKPGAGSKAAPTSTSKYSTVRAVPNVGAAKKAAAAAAAAAAAEAESKAKLLAEQNGLPEKGTLEQKDNKEALGEEAPMSNGGHLEQDVDAKCAAVNHDLAAAEVPGPVVDA